jgi:hypothetical protein
MPDEGRRLPGGIGSDWSCRVFSIADTDNNAPRLLRKVAEVLEELGDAEILDITYCVQTEGPSFESVATVYFFLAEDGRTNLRPIRSG